MSSDRSIAVVCRFYEAVNQQNLPLIATMLASGFTHNDQALGATGLAGMLRGYWAAFPDLHCTIDNVIAENDTVSVRMTWRGVQRGYWLGQPAGGVRANWLVLGTFQINDGRIQRAWVLEDTRALLSQIRFRGDEDERRRREVLGI